MARRVGDKPDLTSVHYQVFVFGSDEELIRSFGSLQRAEAAWNRVRAEFMRRWNLWGMPQAWWRFEAGIPEHLRIGPALVLSEDDADALGALDEARRRYLRSRGIDPTPPIGRAFGAG